MDAPQCLLVGVDMIYLSTVDYQRDEHRVHLIVYHLVWTPKRRKSVLVNAVATECRALIERKCSEHSWQILELAIQPDHIHLFVRVQPNVSASDVVHECKGLTSREWRLPSLWSRSYFASAASNVSAATIARHIAAQTGR